MLGTLIAAVFGAVMIKLFFAVCGHRVTWRLAFALAVLVGLLLVLILAAH